MSEGECPVDVVFDVEQGVENSHSCASGDVVGRGVVLVVVGVEAVDFECDFFRFRVHSRHLSRLVWLEAIS